MKDTDDGDDNYSHKDDDDDDNDDINDRFTGQWRGASKVLGSQRLPSSCIYKHFHHHDDCHAHDNDDYDDDEDDLDEKVRRVSWSRGSRSFSFNAEI